MEEKGQDTRAEPSLPWYAEFMVQGSSQVVPNRSSAAAPQVQYHQGPETLVQDYCKEVAPPAQAQPEVAELSGFTGNKIRSGKFGRGQCNLSRRSCIIIAALAVAALIAIGVGVGVGVGRGSKSKDGPEDSQRDATPSQTQSSAIATTTSSTTVANPRSTDLAVGTTFSSSFTFYGSNDDRGSENCTVSRMACGSSLYSGFTASVSENVFGPKDLGTSSPACGTCWRLDAEFDASDRVLNRTLVVKVNNICPSQGNPLCGQRSFEDENEWGGVVNFNLCSDSGAADELFGEGSGIGLAVGKATRVACEKGDS